MVMRHIFLGILLMWTSAATTYAWLALHERPPERRMKAHSCLTMSLQSGPWDSLLTQDPPGVQDAYDLVVAYHPEWPTVLTGCHGWFGMDEVLPAHGQPAAAP